MSRHPIKTLAAAILIGVAVAGASTLAWRAWADHNAIHIVSDSVGGVVTSAKGPEAGVWVIAETKDLPTRYIKIVVTDDQGRYLIPGLPKANYEIWVRGYGLVDSKPAKASPGERLNLSASIAPDAKAAAEYYPAAYWYALLEPPPASEFPGSGDEGNGIAPEMLTQQYWLEDMKENCMNCHQLGDKATRELVSGGDSVHAWAMRIQMARPKGDPTVHDSGPFLASIMQYNMKSFGERALKMYAKWTDEIAGGALPKETPPRPTGVERNVVITVMDWGNTHYLHDQISSDHRDPTVNAAGPFYGMAMVHGRLEILDPKTLKTTSLPIPGLDGSAYDDTAQVHADEMDAQGRVWMPTSTPSTRRAEPEYCKDGSVPSSKYYPITANNMASQVSVYDPTTKKIESIPLCAGGNHAAFSFDKDNTLFLSGDGQVVSWINTRAWEETHDPRRATGWCPMVLDTSGDGKIDPDRRRWALLHPVMKGAQGEGSGGFLGVADTGTPAPAAGKDTQIDRYLYGLAASPDGSIWEAAYLPQMKSGLVRLERGSNPPLTCKAEFYEAPLKDGKFRAFGVRSMGVDMDGVIWAAFSSGQVGAFDRRKCKILNGPTATGQHCPEGWTFYDLPSPKVANTNVPSDFAYNEWTDRENVVGLGKGTRFFPTINSDSILALPPGQSKFVVFRVPYPRGFYTRGLDFRIDDPKQGWKGRVMNATYSSKAPWHQENGSESSKLVSIQLRPNPLAH